MAPKVFSSINILFLHNVNTEFQARTIKEIPRLGAESDMRVQDLCPHIAALVKNAFRFHVDPQRLQFFKPNNPILDDDAEAWGKDHINRELGDAARKLQYTKLLFKILDLNKIGEDQVDLIVRGEALPDCNSEEDDTVGELSSFGPYRRYRDLQLSTKKLTLSTAAKSGERQRFQRCQSTVIFDGYFVGNGGKPAIAQPIEIFYTPFGGLATDLKNPKLTPTKSALAFAASLISRIGIVTTEQEYVDAIRGDLRKLLDEYIAEVKTSTGRSGDGLVGYVIEGALIPIVMLDLKRTLGEGECDPLAQAAYSLLDRWNGSELITIRDKCPCPTLILAGGGPNLAVLGTVYTDRFIVQRLTDLKFMAQQSTSVDDQTYGLACFFTTLQQFIKDLKTYYRRVAEDQTIPSLTPDSPHPRFFPQPTEYKCRQNNKVIKFQYCKSIDEADAQNLTFLVETTGEDVQKNLIVKFSDRYGFEAHEFLATKGHAPKLYYCGLLDGRTDVKDSVEARGSVRADAGGLYNGPLRMIVMEFLDGKNGLELPIEEWPRAAREGIKAAIECLHAGDFVFGDLRRPNIVFVGEEVKLIDFDWSGKEGEVYYPTGLSSAVTWAKGVESFHKIEKQHDLDMYELLG
ncbi:hypothetical protein VKT23_008310 [Stygiomarasmius scandens]|uniref:Protein kinase domain-containing protein n=1 Tax=Marasmiellus scandens TaxID=2682957 RepID=A0ABR1JIS3_9AGAR